MDLGKELAGVIPPSPVEPDEPVIEPTPEVKEPEGERTIDNVRGELVRKLEESQKKSDERLDAISRQFDRFATDIAGRFQTPKTEPTPQPGGNPLDQYSVDQLQTALVTESVDDVTKQSINAYLPVRVAREEARRIGEENRHADVAHRTRSEANQAAVDRYPDLVDPSKPLHAEVNRILLTRGAEWAKTNPTAVLDAANEAASRLGIGSKRQPRIPGQPPGTPGGAPVKKNTDTPALTDESIDKIGGKLEHLLGHNRDGSRKKFDPKFLKDRSKLYEERYKE